MAGKLKVDEFVTYTFPLDKINDAFALMKEGKGYVLLLQQARKLILTSQDSLCHCVLEHRVPINHIHSRLHIIACVREAEAAVN